MAFIIKIKKTRLLLLLPRFCSSIFAHHHFSSQAILSHYNFLSFFLFFAIKRYRTLNPYVTPIMSGHTVLVHYPLHQSDNCTSGREKLKTSF